MGRKLTVCPNLNQLALSGDPVHADRPNKEDDLVDRVVEILDQVVAARGQTLGEAEVNLLASILEIARSYEARGCTELAVEVMEQMISVAMRTLRSDQPDLLTYQHEPAGAYQADGQINRAVELFEYIVNVED